MPNVTRYHIMLYGSTSGYSGNRAQITLYGETGVLGYVRFHDPNMPFPPDSQSGALIVMHLPSSMFENVIDILRNEQPINYYFGTAAVLSSSLEPVGEGE